MQIDVCGIDMDTARVASHCQQGRNVIFADAEDPDFWSQVSLQDIELIMFSMPNHLDILEVEKQIKQVGYQGKTASVVRYEDEKEQLLKAGIHEVFNVYSRAGTGFADQSILLLKSD